MTKKGAHAPAPTSKLLTRALTLGVLASEQPAATDSLPISKALVRCNGQDIHKKSSTRKNRYLIILNCMLAPAASGRLGTLANLDSREPVMYIEFPQGRLKLFGTLLFPKNKYMVLKTGGNAGVLCEDVFENMIVFSDAWWVGSKEENPDETRLEMPIDLQLNQTHTNYDYSYGAAGNAQSAALKRRGEPSSQGGAGLDTNHYPSSQQNPNDQTNDDDFVPHSQLDGVPASQSRPRRAAAAQRTYVDIESGDEEQDGGDGDGDGGRLGVGRAHTVRTVRDATLVVDLAGSDTDNECNDPAAPGPSARKAPARAIAASRGGGGLARGAAGRGSTAKKPAGGKKKRNVWSDEEDEDDISQSDTSEDQDPSDLDIASDAPDGSDASDSPGGGDSDDSDFNADSDGSGGGGGSRRKPKKPTTQRSQRKTSATTTTNKGNSNVKKRKATVDSDSDLGDDLGDSDLGGGESGGDGEEEEDGVGSDGSPVKVKPAKKAAAVRKAPVAKPKATAPKTAPKPKKRARKAGSDSEGDDDISDDDLGLSDFDEDADSENSQRAKKKAKKTPAARKPAAARSGAGSSARPARQSTANKPKYTVDSGSDPDMSEDEPSSPSEPSDDNNDSDFNLSDDSEGAGRGGKKGGKAKAKTPKKSATKADTGKGRGTAGKAKASKAILEIEISEHTHWGFRR